MAEDRVPLDGPDEADLTPEPDEQDRLDVDARFLLANERTLLAWLRTTMALLAAGVALLHFVDDVPLNNTVGLLLLLLGAAGALIGLVRYRTADTALREHRLPPRGVAPDAVALATFALAVVLVAVVTTQHVTRI